MTKTMDRTAVYGHWHDDPASQFKHLTPFHHEMIVEAQQFVNYWQRCSLSSDFWSQYIALFVPSKALNGWLNKNAVESVLSYLLNELFENCAKFSSGPMLKVHYQSWVGKEQMIFQLTNHIAPEATKPFIRFINKLLESDPEKLYFQKLENSIQHGNNGAGLGFLTLINDYGIQFGYKFDLINSETVQVDVQAYLSLKEFK